MTTSNLAKLILKNHNTGSFGFRKDYFDHLKGTSSAGNSDNQFTKSGTDEIDNQCSKSSINLLNRIYGLIEPYTLELNQSFEDRRYTITPSAPHFSNEEIHENWPYQSSRMVQVYRCRFASIDLCATIRVLEDEVGFFVLPAEFSIRQGEAEQEYGALMRFTYDESAPESNWWVEGKPLTSKRLERYCLLFFDYYTKKSQRLVNRRLSK